MTVTLFSRVGGSLYANSSEVLVAYLGLDVKVVRVPWDKPHKQFEDLFPANNRYTPSLYDDKKGVKLNQQVAVNRYLLSLAKDIKGLNGKKPEDVFEILQWTNRIDSDIVKHFMPILFARFKGAPMNAEQIQQAASGAVRGFDILEQHLQQNTYLVGETLTLADIEGAALLLAVGAGKLEESSFMFDIANYFLQDEWRKNHQAVLRWLNTIWASKPFEAKNAAVAKEQTAQQQPKKKAEKAAKPAAEPTPKKPTHPLADLGKSSIPIDELKRTYSNKETREEAIPYFWNEFYNDEEWSIWQVDYKYNDELTMTFMSNNLIGGFFNRLMASTKFIFGAAVVYGENNHNGIRGAFVIRGKDFMPAFDVAPDWESYDFKRLDSSKPEDREMLEDLWAWDKPVVVNGESFEIADGKVFK